MGVSVCAAVGVTVTVAAGVAVGADAVAVADAVVVSAVVSAAVSAVDPAAVGVSFLVTDSVADNIAEVSGTGELSESAFFSQAAHTAKVKIIKIKRENFLAQNFIKNISPKINQKCNKIIMYLRKNCKRINPFEQTEIRRIRPCSAPEACPKTKYEKASSSIYCAKSKSDHNILTTNNKNRVLGQSVWYVFIAFSGNLWYLSFDIIDLPGGII